MRKPVGRYMNSTILTMSFFSLLMLFGIDSGRAEQTQPATISGYSSEEALKLGEKMYRNGVLPSGEPTQAVVSGYMPAAGTAVSCMSCHLRSGLSPLKGV